MSNPENISAKSPPRLNRWVLSTFAGVAVLAELEAVTALSLPSGRYSIFGDSGSFGEGGIGLFLPHESVLPALFRENVDVDLGTGGKGMLS